MADAKQSSEREQFLKNLDEVENRFRRRIAMLERGEEKGFNSPVEKQGRKNAYEWMIGKLEEMKKFGPPSDFSSVFNFYNLDTPKHILLIEEMLADRTRINIEDKSIPITPSIMDLFFSYSRLRSGHLVENEDKEGKEAKRPGGPGH